MLYFISSVVVSFVFWLVLSGHYTLMLLAIGAVASILVVGLATRMAVIDREGHPIYLLYRAVWYWPWLFWEIVKSGISVSKIIL